MKASEGEDSMNQNVLLGILIPFAGTALGSAMVFFMKKEMNERLQKLLLGFASGVMIAASVWSLLIPAIEMAEREGTTAWIPAAAGFLLGMGFLLLLDTLTPHLHFTEDKPEGMPAHLKKTTMLVLAVTLHNIPEGMAVSVPVFYATGSRQKAFVYSFLSGLAEPLGGVVGYWILYPFINPAFLGGIFAVVAGIMIYISFDELLPAAHRYSDHSAIVGLFAGMFLMAVVLMITG